MKKLIGKTPEGCVFNVSVMVEFKDGSCWSTYTWHDGPIVSCFTRLGENHTYGEAWIGGLHPEKTSHRSGVPNPPDRVVVQRTYGDNTTITETIMLTEAPAESS